MSSVDRSPRLSALLDLEQLADDEFRAPAVFDDGHHLYGGQVVAQAIVACGMTTDAARAPHSMHGCYLRAGSSLEPMRFRVLRDRDGRSFSVRRVEAVQAGATIFTATVSFHQVRRGAPAETRWQAPATAPPEECAPFTIPRLVSFEGRWLPQPLDFDDPYRERRFPVRFWARCGDEAIGSDPLAGAAALAYLSDNSNAGSAFQRDGWWPGPSLDHALWLHDPMASPAEWMLVDLVPVQAQAGRAFYRGTISTAEGRLVASIGQESLHVAQSVVPRLDPAVRDEPDAWESTSRGTDLDR